MVIIFIRDYCEEDDTNDDDANNNKSTINIIFDKIKNFFNYILFGKTKPTFSIIFRDPDHKKLDNIATIICRKSVFEKYLIQSFSLPSPMIDYILKTENHKIYRKLTQSCKYFYSRKPTYVIDDLFIMEKFKDSTMGGIYIPYNHPNMPKFWVVNQIFDMFETTNVLKDLTSKIHRCDAKDVLFHNKEFSVETLKFYTKSKRLKFVQLEGTKIFDNSGRFSLAEEITELLSHASNITLELYNESFSDETATNFSNIVMKKPIKYFRLSCLPANFDIATFCLFGLRNAGRGTSFSLLYHPDVEDSIIDEKRKITEQFTIPKNSGLPFDIDFSLRAALPYFVPYV